MVKKRNRLFLFLLALFSVVMVSNLVYAEWCSDTDEGINLYVMGSVFGSYNGSNYTYTDYCANLGAVNEFYCNGTLWRSLVAGCPANYVCSNGACVLNQTNPQVNNTCNDTDGGLNFFVRGTISGMFQGVPYSYTDTCADDQLIYEKSCSPSGNPSGASQNCNNFGAGYRCSNGACVLNQTNPQVNNTCNDTDGGFNIYLKGSVSGKFNGIYYSYTDYCTNSSNSTNAVAEYSCSYSGGYALSIVDCPKTYTCSGGACKALTSQKVVSNQIRYSPELCNGFVGWLKWLFGFCKKS